ncbi:MAG: urease accessory protein UreE [Burkholderiaceae bacterium]
MDALLRVDKCVAKPNGLASSLLARARVLSLPFADRCKSRLRARLSDGTELALFLTRGTVLRGGDVLVAEDGTFIRVEAQREAVIDARGTPEQLVRAAYHLGNRHIRVELHTHFVRLEDDPVLRELLVGLGLEVCSALMPFEPEPGAYGGGHRHGHEESFDEDYALAQAAYAASEPLGSQPSGQAVAGPGGRRDPSHTHSHSHPHSHSHSHPHSHGTAQRSKPHDSRP